MTYGTAREIPSTFHDVEGGEGKKILSAPSAKLLKKKKLTPITEYFKTQTRFRGLTEEHIAELQGKWDEYRETMS